MSSSANKNKSAAVKFAEAQVSFPFHHFILQTQSKTKNPSQKPEHKSLQQRRLERQEIKRRLSLHHAPNTAAAQYATTKRLDPITVHPIVRVVDRLRHPYREAYSQDGRHVKYEFKWAVLVVGEENFEYNFLGPRKVLKKESTLNQLGMKAGLPLEILSWLLGDTEGEELIMPTTEIDSEDSDGWSQVGRPPIY